ncbi:hypothetical protein MC885_006318 [Smutsia gigantea]|nr:hypothetical protein MC885_006318 [Smutsia gigantea]
MYMLGVEFTDKQSIQFLIVPQKQDVFADGGAMIEVVEADGDAVPENEGAPVLLFIGAEALLEVLVGLEAAAQLHGLPLNPHQGLAPKSTPGFRGHTMRVHRLAWDQDALRVGPSWLACYGAQEEP